MTREEAFDFLDRVARGIAEMFGSTCETLINDMSVPSHPILAIDNGHVSGRTVGSTVDILGSTRQLPESAMAADLVNLFATTPSGQQIKSSTFYLSGEDVAFCDPGKNYLIEVTPSAIPDQIKRTVIFLHRIRVRSVAGIEQQPVRECMTVVLRKHCGHVYPLRIIHIADI